VVSAELFGWLVTILCLAGTILNVKKSIWCFRLWLVGNLAWFAVDVANGCHSRAFLDVVHFILAAWGLAEWGKRRTPASPGVREP
jgi:nicotinamide riboside transporter PnuC